MERYRGTAEPFREVDVSGLVEWLAAIPLEEWPQQDRMDPDYPYPAMVSNPEWKGFKEKTQALVDELSSQFEGCRVEHRMLSVVIPKQKIAEHDDMQPEDWRIRLHVPLVTNDMAVMLFGTKAVHMEVGKAYAVNTEVPHALVNLGDKPRIHFFFDIHEGR